MKEMKSGTTIYSVLNQSNIVDDFTSDYYETISSKMQVANGNGSEFRSTHKLKSIKGISRKDASSPNLSQKSHYGPTVKRVKVDLISAKNRLPSVSKNFDKLSYIDSSNIIDDFDSHVDQQEYTQDDEE